MSTSWRGEAGTRRSSRSGILIKYGNTTIIMTGLLQKFVLLSTTEAEFMAHSYARRNKK